MWSPSSQLSASARVRRVEEFIGDAVPSSLDPLPDRQKYLLALANRMLDPKYTELLGYEDQLYLRTTTMDILVHITRDLELATCVALHDAIDFWTSRLQSPWLAWIEAGPWEWFDTYRKHHPQSLQETVGVVISRTDLSHKVR